MALGYLGLSYRSTVLPYDDEQTPIRLSGKKMLPIIRLDNQLKNESLEIIALLDIHNQLSHLTETQQMTWDAVDNILNRLGPNVHNLAMPYWIWTPEFSPSARHYFIQKKSAKRGPFPALVQRRPEFESSLLRDLAELEPHIQSFWDSNQLTIKDIAIAAHVWGLFVVPEFRFPQAWYDYLMKIKEKCHFNYQEDFWKVL